MSQGWFKMGVLNNNPGELGLRQRDHGVDLRLQAGPEWFDRAVRRQRGPVVLSYGGRWYLAGSLSGGNSTYEWAAKASLPSDWLICTETTPC